MKETLSNQEDIGFLFNVDILIKSRSNALALQSLLEFINNEEQIADFRIQSGIELGKIIEATLQSKKDSFVTLHNERKKPTQHRRRPLHLRHLPHLLQSKHRINKKNRLARKSLPPKHPMYPMETRLTRGLTRSLKRINSPVLLSITRTVNIRAFLAVF